MSKSPHKLVFDLIDIPQQGLTLEGTATPEEMELENEDRLFFNSPIAYNLHLEAINAGHDLLVRGAIRTTAQIICDRCETLTDFDLQNSEVCHQYENAFGTTLDLTDDIREDILCILPQHFLCSEDCKGFCLKCGQNLNLGPCDCEADDEDDDDDSQFTAEEKNPWAALDFFTPEQDAADKTNQ